MWNSSLFQLFHLRYSKDVYVLQYLAINLAQVKQTNTFKDSKKLIFAIVVCNVKS